MEVLHPESSSKLYRNFFLPFFFPAGFFAALVAWAFVWPQSLLITIFVALNIAYFCLNPYKIYVFFRSFNPTKIVTVDKNELQTLAPAELPVYTILLPLKNEAVIVPQIVKNIISLDYPPEKLDIKFVCEVTDTSTITALEREGVGATDDVAHPLSVIGEIIRVPVEKLSTKPRSCNYAAQFARGTYLVIYDAEDKPDPDQLKKALLAFRKSPLDTVCAQARLNFYNTRFNTLTRLFSLEYSFWYDFFLPGNQEIDTAITLGGTSNHFVTAYLKKIGFWDPYNVTEDADLGLRIFRYHQHTTVFNSYTLEEANSQIGNWLRQRTRWQKGFLMTLLVNLRHPIVAIREIGIWRYWQSLFAVTSNFFLPFFNPILWIMFAATFLPFPTVFSFTVPTLLIRYIGFFNLIVGNVTYLGIHLIVVIKKKQLYLLPYIFLLPAYWLLLSLACYRAAWQFIRDPYRWEKTRHGLT
jgi:cellulose synthase/poly-beta-1,6-N-acetylglucosamine synthase-like glycosyltransferase